MMTFANPNVAGLPCDPTKQMVGMIYYVSVNGSGNNGPSLQLKSTAAERSTSGPDDRLLAGSPH